MTESAVQDDRGQATRRFRLPTDKRWLVVASVAVLGAIVGVSLLAPIIAPNDPGALSRNLLSGPGSGHLLGTDSLGRDVLSNIIYGGRISLLVGAAAGAGSFIIGILVGATAGYFGGWADSILMRITELFQVMPTLIIALVIVAVLGRGANYISLAVVLAIWPQSARIMRAQFLRFRHAEFVEASKVAGMRWYEIAFRVILPVAIPPLVVQSTLDLGRGILLEAGLSFLGLGDPEQPSWGGMLRQAQPYLAEAWWLSVPAGLCIFGAVFSVNVLGDEINHRFNPLGRSQ